MNVFDLANNSNINKHINDTNDTSIYISRKQKLKQLYESEEFKTRFNLTHGKGKRKKKKRKK